MNTALVVKVAASVKEVGQCVEVDAVSVEEYGEHVEECGKCVEEDL